METLPLLLALLGTGALGWALRGRQRNRTHHLGIASRTPRALLRRWIDQSPQGWLVLKADHTLAWLNPKAEQLLEVGPGQGRPGQPLNTLRPSTEVRHLIALSSESGLCQRGTWARPSQNLDVLTLPGDGGWIALILEGRHQLEAQLEQQERWVSDVAHELKTPITALMLVGDTLALQAEGRQAVLVGRLQRELRRLQLLVGDLLDLSRLENTPVEPNQRPDSVDPGAVLQGVWGMLEPLARERHVGLRLKVPQGEQVLAAIEAARLHQALLNLLDNALRYSPDGGSIEVGISQRERWCQITIRDQGPGLSDTDRKRLFERFYRGDPARTKGPRTGSGLGLAIVQQIALAHGGLVKARNHTEGGAVLELLLPLC